MPSTPTLALPYPALTDSPDVPYWMGQLANAVETKLRRRRAKMSRPATAQSIASGTVTTVDFTGGTIAYDTEGAAPNGMCDLVNDQLVVKTAGYWVFTGRVAFQSNSTGYRGVLIVRGANDYLVDDYRAGASGQATITTLSSDPVLCAVGDTIRLQVVQNSTVPLDLANVNGKATSLTARYDGSV